MTKDDSDGGKPVRIAPDRDIGGPIDIKSGAEDIPKPSAKKE